MQGQRKPIRPVIVVSASIVLFLALADLAAQAAQRRAGAQPGEWKVPARAARKTNPLKPDAATLKAGKTLYAAECADCHGNRGAGDGPGARDLKTTVPDLSKPAMWRQSDGELFWKLSTGRGDMPGFDDMLGEDERWQVLTYAREAFAPRGGGAAEDAAVASQRRQREGKRE